MKCNINRCSSNHQDDQTQKTSTKGGYHGSDVENIDSKMSNDHHTPSNDNPANTTTADAVTTTAEHPTPATIQKVVIMAMVMET